MQPVKIFLDGIVKSLKYEMICDDKPNTFTFFASSFSWLENLILTNSSSETLLG